MRLTIALLSSLLFGACFVETDPGEPEDVEGTGALQKAAPKVDVCHIPPGNPSNAHTISVSPSAVPAHLNHGDTLGACGGGGCVPTPEVCGDSVDNDCDGDVDETCVCTPGSQTNCYSGPANTNGVGACHGGAQVCAADGSGYGPCTGEVLPAADACGDGVDNNCDGQTDETCVCAPGSMVPCYTGPAFTNGIGACHGGTMVCDADGSGYGACGGQVTPAPEVCADGVDNDCDGLTDEGCIGNRAWDDADRDGIQDAGETGMAGVTFLLRSASTGALIAVATSDASGTYWFAEVFASTYYIEVVTPPDFTLSDPDRGTDDTADSDFDSESGGVTAPFNFGGGIDGTRDAGFYSVIET